MDRHLHLRDHCTMTLVDPTSSSATRRPTSTEPSLPFELWRVILTAVFDDVDVPRRKAMENAHQHHEPCRRISDLHAKLDIFKGLWVNKHWYINARDVFWEELSAETSQSLKGIRDALAQDCHHARNIRRVRMSFPRFRDSESCPSKPFEYFVPEGVQEGTEEYEDINGEVARRATLARYWQPTTTKQNEHWDQWQSLCQEVFRRSPSLRNVQITFTSDFTAQYASGDSWTTLGRADLNHDGILNGLLSIRNLRKLELVDPSPLKEYGTALEQWKKLESASIVLSSFLPEIENLPDTVFCLPPDLERLKIHDFSDGHYHWPSHRQITSCKDLKVLDLGIGSDKSAYEAHANTMAAIELLLSSYQDTLTELTLRSLVPTKPQFGDLPELHHSFDRTFNPIFESAIKAGHRICFKSLKKLTIDATEDDWIFWNFDAPELEEVEITTMLALTAMADLLPTTPDEGDEVWTQYWMTRLQAPSLKNVKAMKVSYTGNRLALSKTASAFARACEQLGMAFVSEGDLGW